MRPNCDYIKRGNCANLTWRPKLYVVPPLNDQIPIKMIVYLFTERILCHVSCLLGRRVLIGNRRASLFIARDQKTHNCNCSCGGCECTAGKCATYLVGWALRNRPESTARTVAGWLFVRKGLGIDGRILLMVGLVALVALLRFVAVLVHRMAVGRVLVLVVLVVGLFARMLRVGFWCGHHDFRATPCFAHICWMVWTFSPGKQMFRTISIVEFRQWVFSGENSWWKIAESLTQA